MADGSKFLDVETDVPQNTTKVEEDPHAAWVARLETILSALPAGTEDAFVECQRHALLAELQKERD